LAQRGFAPPLREFAPKRRLELLGFSWILSSESRDLNGLGATSSELSLFFASLSEQGAPRPGRGRRCAFWFSDRIIKIA
jgi:hypothetical protein